MIRSIEFPVDKNWIKNPNNNPLATMGARQGAAARTRLCIATIGLILGEHFKAPQPFHAAGDGHVRPNRWAVTLTRISMGTLDPITGGASMKVVQDAVATWCGVKNERDPVWAWTEPIRQEKRAKGYFGVRIEIEDLAPGEPRRVTLATASVDRFVWLATQRLKEARSMTKKSRSEVPSWAREHVEAEAKRRAGEVVQTGRVLSYQPDAAARGASSAARGKAEAAFSKLTGARAAPTLESLTSGQRDTMADVIRHHYAPPDPRVLVNPTVEELRASAERVLGPGGAARMAARDPGDEAPARDLTDCETCGVRVGVPCVRLGAERMVYGVHVARARAAGLTVPADDRAAVKPAREAGLRFTVDAAGIDRMRRRLATVPGQARLVARRAYAALPWEQPRCEACAEDREACAGPVTCERCKGRGYRVAKLTREQRLEGVDVDRPEARYKVPLAERARWGSWVTLHRTERTIAAHGVCWVYLAEPG